jgi:hypothetical protein
MLVNEGHKKVCVPGFVVSELTEELVDQFVTQIVASGITQMSR